MTRDLGDFHRQSYRAETLDSTMDQNRFLFRAGREGYTYPELLQIRSGAAAQILMPSEQARRRTRIVSTFIALAYVFVVGPLVGGLGAFSGLSIVAPIVAVAGFFVGLIGILVWWDRMSLPLLAENPRSIRDIELIGVQSFRHLPGNSRPRARRRSPNCGVRIPRATRGSHAKGGLRLPFRVSTLTSLARTAKARRMAGFT